MPSIINVKKLLYLDTDMIILTDLKDLFAYDLDDKVIGMVQTGIVKTAWNADRKVINAAGVPDDAPYFNAGTILFDVEKWNKLDFTNTCLGFTNDRSGHLPNCDQTVFNSLFYQKIQVLPKKYNVIFKPLQPVLEIKDNIDIIAHFLGCPKPWDLFGGIYTCKLPGVPENSQEDRFFGL